jgi:two-component system repressor protein LuxO
MTQTPILLIDDNQSHLMLYSSILTDAGFETLTATSSQDALAINTEFSPQIALIDLMLPDGSGQDLIPKLRETNPTIKPIVVTAYASVHRAIAAMRLGVSDFLIKPVDPQILVDAITNARSDRPHTLSSSVTTKDAPPLGGLLGSSDAMKRVYTTIRAVSRSDANVFVTGENGTGKNMCAEAIHALSHAAEGPFVAVHCASTPVESLGAEIFGHAAGAHASMPHAKIGALQKADGGSLFLDEICDLDNASQARLLEFLQTSTVTPLGASDPIPIKARIICASSRPPLEQVNSGALRADLYYRLFVVPIHLPPLRERGLDVIEIAEAMVARFAANEKRPALVLSQETKALFLSYCWPGNIRELMNLLWNCVVVNDGPEIEEHHLPQQMLETTPSLQQQAAALPPISWHNVLQAKTLAEIEREIIEFAINRSGGSIPKASKALDVSPSTLYRKLDTWGRPARGPRQS